MYKVGDILRNIGSELWQITSIEDCFYYVTNAKGERGMILFSVAPQWTKVNKFSVGDNESAAIPKYKLGQEVYHLGVKYTIFSIIHRADGIFYDVTSNESRFHSLPESDLSENDKNAKNEIKVGDIVDLSSYYRDYSYVNCNFKVKNIDDGILTVATNINKYWAKKT